MNQDAIAQDDRKNAGWLLFETAKELAVLGVLAEALDLMIGEKVDEDRQSLLATELQKRIERLYQRTSRMESMCDEGKRVPTLEEVDAFTADKTPRRPTQTAPPWIG